MIRLASAITAVLILSAAPAVARTPFQDTMNSIDASVSLTDRIGELIPILKGEGTYDAYFSAAFREQVPKAKLDALMKQVEAAIGTPVSIEKITPATPFAATLRVGFTKGVATMRIAVDPNTPHRVTGLLITGTEPRGDTLSQLEASFKTLPGQSGYAIYALSDGAPKLLAGMKPELSAPLGSSFKLWVLAAAAQQVADGTRHWSDILPLVHTNLPGGTLSSWPDGAPLTLQSLTTFMLSQSDNSATDTLIGALGPDKVDAMVSATGVAQPDRTLPVLTTAQAFALKDPANAEILAAWQSATTPDARRAVLAQHKATLAKPVRESVFSGKPVAVDSVEWFASPADEAKVLDWLRRNAGDTALTLMAVNPGTNADIAGKFAYIGYKGGSEPGVIAMNYLVRRKDGRWFAVTGNWHRDDAGVKTESFASLMNRALALTAKID